MNSKLSSVFDGKFLRKLELLRIASRKAFAGKSRGERRSTRRGSSVEFADYRQYFPGDDFRYIDWHAFARMEQLYLKLFVEEEDLSVYLLLDTSKSMAFGSPQKFDVARRLAASLAYISLSSLDRVSLTGFGAGRQHTLPPARGRARVFTILEFLDGIVPDGQTSLDRTVEEFLITNRRPGVVIVIGDFFDPSGYQRPLNRLIFEHFQPMVIQVLSPEELNPPLRGDLRLVDAETNQAVDVSMNQRARKLYKTRLEELLSGLERFCLRRQITFLRACTDTAFEDLILRYLRGAQFVE